jgi:fructokinase
MRKIFAIGESLLDIIFSDGHPDSAKAGGSMLNSVVSLGRIGLPVCFITEYGMDSAGKLIDAFLEQNRVSTGYVFKYEEGQTAIALAFLDSKKNAHYSFYKNYPRSRLNMNMPRISKDDIFLYGSIYSITPEVRKPFFELVKNTSANEAICIYDPNFRKPHLKELDKLRPMIIENMDAATIIRASDEDFRNIFGTLSPDEAWDLSREHCSCLIYTANEEGVFVRTRSFRGRFPVKKIKPVSTIGAGDNFNAGIIASLYLDKISSHDILKLGKKEWDKIISLAIDFATDVCMSYDNYISAGFAEKIRTIPGISGMGN